MKITYTFITGETIEVEADESVGGFILESRRKEHADNERHRYHAAYSLDNEAYTDHSGLPVEEDPCGAMTATEDADHLTAALAKLTPVQRSRLMKLADGMTIAQIARSEGTSFNSVKESIAAAQKKMKKLL